MKSTKLWQIRLTENLLTTFALFILCIQGAPCQLHSKPEGQFFSVMLSDSVVDETPCNPTTRDMCINGVCRVTMKWQALLLVLTRWNRLHRNGRHPQSHPRIIIIIFTNLLNIVLYSQDGSMVGWISSRIHAHLLSTWRRVGRSPYSRTIVGRPRFPG